MKKSGIALVITAAMAFSSMPVYAENTKHERVYVVTDPSGQVQTLIDNVRLENKDGLDEIEDCSMLTEIENVSGKETFTQEGEKIIWQAGGEDITYQGTSDQSVPVVPVVRVTADGKEVSKDDLGDLSGKITMEVSYQTSEGSPAVAASLIPLPSDGVSDIEVTDAWLVSESGMQCIAGWGIAGSGEISGADETAYIPDSFTVSFTADHADLSWMYTVVSAEPVEVLKEMVQEHTDEDGDLSLEMEDARTLLEALSAGEEVPEAGGKTQDIGEKINELNQGLTDLDSGAKQVADGAKALSQGAETASEGAQELSTGLETLAGNNQALTDGMSTLFDAILNTANEQIAASGLSEAGITVPELTQENYREVLEGLLEQFSPEGVRNAVSEQVRAQVEENREQIEAAVDEEVKKKVLEAILEKVKLEMTVDEYYAAVDSGDVSALVSAGIDVALKEQLNTEEVQASRNEAVEEQVEKLVEEHTQEYLDSEEGQAKQASATEAYDSLSALSTQLLQVGQLKDGVDQYTDGVEQASTGAKQLSEGLGELKSGAGDLSDGSGSLSDGMSTLHTSLTEAQKQAADTLLPYMESSLVQLAEEIVSAAENSGNCGYDLRPENMNTVTSFIIRTDF